MDKHELQALRTISAKLTPTPLETPEHIGEFIQENPPGTRFIAKIKSDVDTSLAVTEAARERVNSRGVEFDFCFGNLCIYKVK